MGHANWAFSILYLRLLPDQQDPEVFVTGACQNPKPHSRFFWSGQRKDNSTFGSERCPVGELHTKVSDLWADDSVNKERPRIGIETPAVRLASSHLLVELPSRVYNLVQSPYLVAFWRSKKGTSAWHLPPVWQEVPKKKKKKQESSHVHVVPSETSWGMTVWVFQIAKVLHDKSCLSCLWFIRIFIFVLCKNCHPSLPHHPEFGTLLALSSRGLSGHLLPPHHHHHVRHHLWISTATDFYPTALEFKWILWIIPDPDFLSLGLGFWAISGDRIPSCRYH